MVDGQLGKSESSVTCARDPRSVSSPGDSVGSGGSGGRVVMVVWYDSRSTAIDVSRESTLATLSSADTLTGQPDYDRPSQDLARTYQRLSIQGRNLSSLLVSQVALR